MSVENIQQALIQRLVAGMPMVNPNQFAWENKVFTPPQGTFWIQSFFMPVKERIATLSPEGFDESDGLFQVDLNYPTGVGEANLRKTINFLRACFIPGKVSYSGQVVTILSRSRTGGKVVNGFFKVIFTVRWRAQIARTD